MPCLCLNCFGKQWSRGRYCIAAAFSWCFLVVKSIGVLAYHYILQIAALFIRKVGGWYSHGWWANNSLGDILLLMAGANTALGLANTALGIVSYELVDERGANADTAVIHWSVVWVELCGPILLSRVPIQSDGLKNHCHICVSFNFAPNRLGVDNHTRRYQRSKRWGRYLICWGASKKNFLVTYP